MHNKAYYEVPTSYPDTLSYNENKVHMLSQEEV
jgi:hypothetical protein